MAHLRLDGDQRWVTPAVLPATIGRYRIFGLRGVGASAVVYHAFDPKHAKTAHCVVRYAKLGWSGDEVVAVVDRSKAGRDAGDFVGDVGKGIPVVSYNADGARNTAHARQAYIGQDLYTSGFEMGKRIATLVP